MPTAPKHKPGDRVVGMGILFSRKHGAIVKLAASSALVRWDGADQDERVNLAHLRPETAEHVAARDAKRAMEAWRDARPGTKVARVEHDPRWGHSDTEIGASVTARTPAEMRQAAEELRALADWFEQRPIELGKETK